MHRLNDIERMIVSQVDTKRIKGGLYKLVWRSSGDEVYPGERFVSTSEAVTYYLNDTKSVNGC